MRAYCRSRTAVAPLERLKILLQVTSEALYDPVSWVCTGFVLIYYSWVDVVWLSATPQFFYFFWSGNASIYIDVYSFSSYLRFKIRTILSIMVLFKAWSTYGELRAFAGCSKGMAQIVLELSQIQQSNSSAMSKHPSMLPLCHIMLMIWLISFCYSMPKMPRNSRIVIIMIVIFLCDYYTAALYYLIDCKCKHLS